MKQIVAVILFFVLGLIVSTQTDNLLVGLLIGLVLAFLFTAAHLRGER